LPHTCATSFPEPCEDNSAREERRAFLSTQFLLLQAKEASQLSYFLPPVCFVSLALAVSERHLRKQKKPFLHLNCNFMWCKGTWQTVARSLTNLHPPFMASSSASARTDATYSSILCMCVQGFRHVPVVEVRLYIEGNQRLRKRAPTSRFPMCAMQSFKM
jgi:hypothetical protein